MLIILRIKSLAKGLVAELTLLHIQSAWGSREERVRTAGLAACYNYFSKKKKKNKIFVVVCFFGIRG